MQVVAAVGLGLGLVGVAGQAASEVSAARASAKISKLEARSIRSQAKFDESEDRRRTAKILGKSRAIAASSGIDPGAGSPLLQLLDSAREAELSALNIRHRGERGAEAKELQAKFTKARIPGIYLGSLARAGSLLGSFATFGGSGGGSGGG